MKLKPLNVSFLLLFLLISACNNEADQVAKSSTLIDSLQINDLNVVISTESEFLGEPREIVNMDEDHFAVYDHGYHKIMVFTKSGEKEYEFGNTGEGPGEWDPMGGASDLGFMNGKFITTNQNRLLFDVYDLEGNHLETFTYSSYLKNSDKDWLDDHTVLVSTYGRENALAIVLDLESEEKVKKRIGKPATHYTERLNLDQERTSYANGEVPESAKNEVLVAKLKDGFLLFVNTTGELRKYNIKGDLIFQSEIPASAKKPIFEFVVEKNKELQSPGVVFPLEYAKEIHVKNDLIYIFMPKISINQEVPESRILVYNLNGELVKQFVLTDKGNDSFLYGMMVDNNHTIYFNDIMNARILSFKPETGD